MSQTPPGEIDPVARLKFRVAPTDRIATAGSCFAQHITRWLREHGYNFLQTETAHPLLPADIAERFGYGIYTARFGNIYTPRQLLQLIQRAYGTLRPHDDIWACGGSFYDPYRPAIQPGGFATEREYYLDRAAHFAAIRAAVESLDVLVFTLGLTECWRNANDGCVYPVCPGTQAGEFDSALHEFHNLSVNETISDLQLVVSEIRMVNPGFRLILTVSPVPLAATAVDRHVLVSTTYSKAVLRIAAETLAEDPNILYFPSYEMIMNPAVAGRYLAADLRSVTQEGVDRVMRLFQEHAIGEAVARPIAMPSAPDHFEKLKDMVAILCDEDALDPDTARP